MLVKDGKFIKIITVFCLVVFIMAGLMACGKKNPIVGEWVSEDNEDILKFNDNGSCSAPFTYNAGWMESANNYAIKEDGTLVFSSNEGHANDSFEQVDTEEEALDNKDTYYISGDILIIEKDKYTRVK